MRGICPKNERIRPIIGLLPESVAEEFDIGVFIIGDVLKGLINPSGSRFEDDGLIDEE